MLETCIISGWTAAELMGRTIENTNTAVGKSAFSNLGNGAISASAGVGYGLKIYNGTSLEYELAMCEGNATRPHLYCSITKRCFFITGNKEVAYQDVYFKCFENGYDWLKFLDGSVMWVAKSNEGESIYN